MTTIPASAAQAFAELHDEIAAVDAAQLVPISVDISFAHQIALAAADRIDALMPELERMPGVDIVRIRKLRMYAAACQHAHVRATTPAPADRRLPRLLEEGAKLRQDLLATAELLAHFGDVSAKRVAAIRSGTGHVAIASGLAQLAILFTEVWDRVASRVPIPLEMVERAPVLAVELHMLLGAKMFPPIAKVTDAQSMRQRAFTLLVHAYAECQSAVAYLRRNHGDAALFTPSMFLKQRARRASPPTRRTALPIAVSAPKRTPIVELAESSHAPQVILRRPSSSDSTTAREEPRRSVDPAARRVDAGPIASPASRASLPAAPSMGGRLLQPPPRNSLPSSSSPRRREQRVVTAIRNVCPGAHRKSAPSQRLRASSARHGPAERFRRSSRGCLRAWPDRRDPQALQARDRGGCRPAARQATRPGHGFLSAHHGSSAIRRPLQLSPRAPP